MSTAPARKKSPGRPKARPRVGRVDLDVLARKQRMLGMREAGMNYREIGAAEGVSPSVAHRQVMEAAAAGIPTEDSETVRRMELERIDKLMGRWMPSAMGTAKVTVVLEGLGPVEVPIPLDASIKASTHLLTLMAQKWKWSGLDNAPTGRQPVDGMTEKDLNDELAELVERLELRAPTSD